MKKLTLSCELWVPATIDTVWEWSLQPANLAKISPEEYNTRVNFEGPIVHGSRFEIFTTPPNLPGEVRWVSLIQNIVAIGPKRQFTDLRNEGPFAYWKHTHVFEEGEKEVISQNANAAVKLHHPGTWIKDRVEYAMPLGPAGLLAHKLFARKQLGEMFAYRHVKLAELFSK